MQSVMLDRAACRVHSMQAVSMRRPAHVTRHASVHAKSLLHTKGPGCRNLICNAADRASYLQGERKTNEDVMKMREEAQAHMDALLQELRGGGSSNGSGKGRVSHQPSAGAVAIKAKLKNAVGVMQQGLVERDTEVRLLLLAAMSGEHILFIGPPGTAKSEIGRRLNTLVSGTYFERLLTRFSVPEELFGPLSMRALEDDKYVRQTRGYLPEAEVAFIDEIFKANSAILNTLLTLINERLFDNGSSRVKVPLLTVVGASNELPESEELDALYDRFLVRRLVRQVSSAGVGQMLSYYTSSEYERSSSSVGASNGASGTSGHASGNGSSSGAGVISEDQKLTREDIRECKRQALRTVKVPQSVIQLLTDLRSHLQEKFEPPVYVSDRRLVKSIQLLQVGAYCNGRDSVSEYDCLLLQHLLWQKPEQADRINDWVVGQLSVDDGLKQVEFLLSGLFSRTCRALGHPDKTAAMLAEVVDLREVLVAKYRQVDDNLTDGFPVVLDNLWLGAEESEAIAMTLQPKLNKTRSAVESVLYDVATLEVALLHNSEPVMLANLMPKEWAKFIRNSDITDVKPIGTRPRP